MVNLKTTVQVALVAGKEYDFVFWAQDPTCDAYTVDLGAVGVAGTKTVTVDYAEIATNEDKADAFFAGLTEKITNQTALDVKLYRPFSQVNVATTDLTVAEAAGFNTDNATVAIATEAYNAFNLLDGECAGALTAVTFPAVAPCLTETFPKTPVATEVYSYLTMNYVLVDADKELVPVTIAIKDATGTDNTISVANVPVQRNYRTNIYGALLTNEVDINVEIIPDYQTPDYEKEVVFTHVSTAAELKDALTAGEDVMLDEDIEVTAPVRVESDTQIELNGNELSLGTNYLLATANSTVVVSGGTIDTGNGSNGVIAQEGATLVINDAEITGNTSTLVKNITSGHVVLNNVEITATGTSYPVQAASTGSVTLNDCDITAAKPVMTTGSGTLVIAGGSITSTAENGAVQSTTNATVEITGTEITGKAGVTAYGASYTKLSGCTITSDAYAFSTNASDPDTASAVIEDCVFNATVPIMYNLRGTLTVKNTTLNGSWIGAFIRVGTVKMEDVKITLTPVDPAKATELVDTNWGTGSNAPSAALTIGNRNASASYQYATNVDLKNCTLEVAGANAAGFHTVYAYANAEAGKGVTFTYDTATAAYIEAAGALVTYGSSNITVNGVAQN